MVFHGFPYSQMAINGFPGPWQPEPWLLETLAARARMKLGTREGPGNGGHTDKIGIQWDLKGKIDRYIDAICDQLGIHSKP